MPPLFLYAGGFGEFADYSRCLPCPAICNSGGGSTCPRALWSRRRCSNAACSFQIVVNNLETTSGYLAGLLQTSYKYSFVDSVLVPFRLVLAGYIMFVIFRFNTFCITFLFSIYKIWEFTFKRPEVETLLSSEPSRVTSGCAHDMLSLSTESPASGSKYSVECWTGN